MDIKNFEFLGVPVTSFTHMNLLKIFIKSIKKDEKLVIYGHSLGILHLVILYPEVLEYFNKIDLFVSDGHKFHIIGKFLGYPFNYFLSIPDTSNLLLSIANKYELKLLLLGSTQDNNNLAKLKIEKRFEKIKVLEGIDGYFTKEEEEEVISKINKMKPDIIFIGMNTPKKLKFIYDHRDKLAAKITILNGGMIDVLAGKTKQVPKILKKLGVAAFFRFIQEPRLRFKRTVISFSLELCYFIPSILINIGIRKKVKYSVVDTYAFKFFTRHKKLGRLLR